MKLKRGACLIFAFAGCLACSNAAQPLVVASSADQATYAVRYPDKLAETRGRFAEQESKVTRLCGEIGAFPSAVDTKNWNHVVRAYKLSDEAGKSSAYVERYEQNDGVNSFFSEEKEKLGQAVAGSVAYSAKQNNCTEPGDVGGSAAHAMNKAVDKQLKERTRASNEAQAYVDAHAEAIGSKSVEKIRDQIDTLTELSYTANIGVERSKQQLQALIQESSKVQSTLESTAKEADEQAQDATQPAADRKAAQARADAAKASASRVESERQQAQFVVEQMDERIKKIRADYEKAFDALIDAAEQKAAATPEAKP